MVLRYDQKSRETLNLKFVGFGKAYRMQGARRYMLPVAVWPVTSLVHACNHALVHADVSLKRRVVYGHFFFFPTAIPRNTNHFSASPTRLRLSASQLPSSILLQFVILYRIDISFFFQTVFFFRNYSTAISVVAGSKNKTLANNKSNLELELLGRMLNFES